MTNKVPLTITVYSWEKVVARKKFFGPDYPGLIFENLTPNPITITSMVLKIPGVGEFKVGKKMTPYIMKRGDDLTATGPVVL